MASTCEREESIMLVDIFESGSPCTKAKRKPSVKFDDSQLKAKEHKVIFEDMVEELEHEIDAPLEAHLKQPRRGSLQSLSSTSTNTTASLSITDLVKEGSTAPRPRRHSSFHSAERGLHREHHKDMKAYFHDTNHHKRSAVIEGLFQFQLSVSMSMASMDALEEIDSGALYRSCPILTYMNDDDEDSVEMHRVKRPSLSVIKDEGDYFDEDGDCDLSEDEDFELTSSFKSSVKRLSQKNAEEPVTRSYTQKLGGYNDLEEKPRAKKRTTSYAMLSLRLDDHPRTVLEEIRSASMSNLPTPSLRRPSFQEAHATQKPPSSKRLMMFKMSHDEGSFSRDNTDLTKNDAFLSRKDSMVGSNPPFCDVPPEPAIGMGRAA